MFLTVGPEGAIYVLDFYREVIETPLSLPDDIKKRLNLESRGRGRIWRIVPEGFKTKAMPRMDTARPRHFSVPALTYDSESCALRLARSVPLPLVGRG